MLTCPQQQRQPHQKQSRPTEPWVIAQLIQLCQKEGMTHYFFSEMEYINEAVSGKRHYPLKCFLRSYNR